MGGPMFHGSFDRFVSHEQAGSDQDPLTPSNRTPLRARHCANCVLRRDLAEPSRLQGRDREHAEANGLMR
jgi:hypothetical protein